MHFIYALYIDASFCWQLMIFFGHPIYRRNYSGNLWSTDFLAECLSATWTHRFGPFDVRLYERGVLISGARQWSTPGSGLEFMCAPLWFEVSMRAIHPDTQRWNAIDDIYNRVASSRTFGVRHTFRLSHVLTQPNSHISVQITRRCKIKGHKLICLQLHISKVSFEAL